MSPNRLSLARNKFLKYDFYFNVAYILIIVKHNIKIIVYYIEFPILEYNKLSAIIISIIVEKMSTVYCNAF